MFRRLITRQRTAMFSEITIEIVWDFQNEQEQSGREIENLFKMRKQ